MVQRFQKPLGVRSDFPYVYYKALRDHSQTLGSVFAEADWFEHFRMTDPQPAEEIAVRGVTPEFFDGLGVHPLTGRLLTAGDATGKFDTPPAVLSYNFWRKRFGGDPSVVRGRTLAIAGHRFSIVGVLPRGFHGLSVDSGPDVRIPLQAYSLLTPDFNVDHAEFELAGRLTPGVTVSKAQAECLAFWGRVMKDYYEETEKRSPETVSRC